ncbi:MAG: hypothetical protein AAGE52_16605 [Myxococcota bacterium]
MKFLTLVLVIGCAGSVDEVSRRPSFGYVHALDVMEPSHDPSFRNRPPRRLATWAELGRLRGSTSSRVPTTVGHRLCRGLAAWDAHATFFVGTRDRGDLARGELPEVTDERACGEWGRIGRALLYVASTYECELSEDSLSRAIHWSQRCPATEQEVERALSIGYVQRNVNPFVARRFEVVNVCVTEAR